MPPLTIVPQRRPPDFNIFKNSLFSHGLRFKILLIDQLRLEAFEKAFGHRIVPTVTFPTHTLYNQWVFFQQFCKRMTSILHSSI
jgi:hypothetical protein